MESWTDLLPQPDPKTPKSQRRRDNGGGRLGGQAGGAGLGGGKAAEEEDSFCACGRNHSTIPPKFNNNSFVGL